MGSLKETDLDKMQQQNAGTVNTNNYITKREKRDNI